MERAGDLNSSTAGTAEELAFVHRTVTSVFINLPVNDLSKSKDFYTSFGWTVNPAFSDDNAGSIIVSDTIYIMLLIHDHYRRFTDKEIAATSTTSAVLNAISVDTAEASTAWWTRHWPPVPQRASRRTMASCGPVRSRIRTAIRGRFSGWIRSPRPATGPPCRRSTRSGPEPATQKMTTAAPSQVPPSSSACIQKIHLSA